MPARQAHRAPGGLDSCRRFWRNMVRQAAKEMKRTRQAKKPAAKKPRKARVAVIPDEDKPAVTEESTARILERPGGFFWQEKAGGEEYGPFATRAEAEADMQSDGGAERGDDLPAAVQEAEAELGINEWIDPETGVPAEEHGPRIEDH